MASVNKVILVGNLGADPEIRHTQAGTKVCNFRMATSESWTDKRSGEKRERTEWHAVVCFNDPLSEIMEQYLKKGSKVYIEGQLQTRKWSDKDGNDRYSTEVVLQPYRGTMVLLDRADNSRVSKQTPIQDELEEYDDQTGELKEKSFGNGKPAQRELDDEVPF